MQWGNADAQGVPVKSAPSIIHAWAFLKPLIFTHGHINNTHVSPIKPKPAACCCCPDTSRAARVSLLASSKSAGGPAVEAMTLSAGSSTSAGLRWHEDIWPRSISGSGCRGETVLSATPILQPSFMSWIFIRVLYPHTRTVVQFPNITSNLFRALEGLNSQHSCETPVVRPSSRGCPPSVCVLQVETWKDEKWWRWSSVGGEHRPLPSSSFPHVLWHSLRRQW